jgi:hypothetical protein
MDALSLASQISLYVLLALIALTACLLWPVQIRTLLGHPFHNPDGSKDDWREQEIIWGIAFADIVLACPAAIAGVILVAAAPRWGFFLLALVSFWLLWANIMTTANSLRFHHPRITLAWFIGFPFGALLGLAYLIWLVVHFDAVMTA